ncbi:EamA-like transporter family [Musa troglodytarum]|uniref:EamA-like transporter family n=1 Tax=Musa troglodytarum TaxID=320322 RepID=A0A9E7KX35_9LILI|nr:EamA-like transporter family [Musa troglodytarum]
MEEFDATNMQEESQEMCPVIYRRTLQPSLVILSRKPGQQQRREKSSAAMAQVGGACSRYKPHLLMTMAQIGYTILYFITEASFNQGLNPHVYITYRHVVAALVMWPFAYFLERYMAFDYIRLPSPLPETVSHAFACSLSQKTTAKAHMEIVSGDLCPFLSGGQPNSKHVLRELKVHLPDLRCFHGQHHCRHDLCHRRSAQVLTHFGCDQSHNQMLDSSLQCPTLWPRMEHLYLRSPRGVAKAVGTIVSLAGVTTMTLFKGPTIKNFWGPLIQIDGNAIHESWLKGSTLTITSCITWSMWYIMQVLISSDLLSAKEHCNRRFYLQAITLKRYPAQLSLTTWMCFIGAAQSAIFTAFVEHKPAAWRIGLDVKLWSILYAGVVCSGLIIYIQLWCTEAKGPVFVTMFNPVSTIMVALLAYFVFGERLFLGSIIGGIVVIIGLYSVLWGKERDQETETMSPEDASFVAPGKETGGSQDTFKNMCGKADNTKGSEVV